MKPGKLLGILILFAVIGAAIAWRFLAGDGATLMPGGRKTEVFGYVGSEKANFLDDEEVVKALSKRGLTLDYSKAGSVEIAVEGFHAKGRDGGKVDFLWPSSQAALELYLSMDENPRGKNDLVFSSPLVLYTWTEVSDALAAAGYVTTEDGVAYLTGFPALLAAIEEGKTWKDLGAESLYGKAAIVSTDPARSNSGLLFASLMATVIHGDVPDTEAMRQLLPRLSALFKRLGYMEHSTGVLFEQYLRIGSGQYPILVGYENQLVEFRLANPELWKSLESRVRVLYPVPTVWSSHPMIALTKGGELLLEVLREEQLQDLAWRLHGFRTGSSAAVNDISAIGVQGIPRAITRTVPLPVPEAVKVIYSYISEN